MNKEQETKNSKNVSKEKNTKKSNTSKNQNLNKTKTKATVKSQNENEKNNSVKKNASTSKSGNNKKSGNTKKNTSASNTNKNANEKKGTTNTQEKKSNSKSFSKNAISISEKSTTSKSNAKTSTREKQKISSPSKSTNKNPKKKSTNQKKTENALENKILKTLNSEKENTQKNVSSNPRKKNTKEKKPLEKVKLKDKEAVAQNIITTKSLDIVKNIEKTSKKKKKAVVLEEPKEEINKKKKIYKKKINFDTAQPKNKRDSKEIVLSKKKENVKQTKVVESKRVEKNKKASEPRKHFTSKIIWLLFIMTFIATFAFSTINIVNKSIDKTVTLKEQEEIEEMTVMEELPNDEEAQEIINAPKENVVSDYWKYVRLPLMKVDFNELLAKNEETVAFLKVNGTNINYPVVQTKDNTYYLDHSYDKTKNDAGWVFMDYRNNTTGFDDNTIIYAHGMTSFSSENTTMFGSLRKILKSDWYENTDNYVIYLSTPTMSTLWQVFSVYSIPTETYYLTTNFGTKKSHEEFINTLVSRSVFDFNAEVNTEDKILTLSTCYDSATKVVMHAKLIKKQNLGE